MRKLNATFLVFILFILFSNSLYAQKIVKTRGESGPVRVETNMTEENTREKAKELAMINAIENAFGTYVEQQADIVIESGRESFNIIGTTRVKGYWIETSKGFPKYREFTRNDGDNIENWIECEIEGKVKKISSVAQLDYLTLNGPNKLYRTSDYLSGEQFYLYFKSPVDGYLAVFLEAGSTIYRLLPYQDMSEGNRNAVKIEEDREYIFFSKQYNYFMGDRVDELVLYTYFEYEYDYIYIVFATELFIKPLLDKESVDDEYKDNYFLPKSCNKENFNKWLADNRATSDSFQDIKTKIRIKK